MKAEQINPFIASTINVFKMMAGTDVRRDDLQVKDGGDVTHDVTAVISMQGVLIGAVSLSFPEETALKIAGKFAMTEFTEMNDEVADAVAELVNMIAGGAKADLAKAGVPAQLAIPQVIVGKDHQIHYPPDIPIVEVLFGSDCGEFTLEVCVKENDPEEAEVAEAMSAQEQ